jgi:ABC-type transport system substrate-binding protein
MRRRTWSLLTIALFACAVTTAAAQNPPPKPTPTPTPTPTATLTGKWTMTLDMQMGTATPALEFTQQGEKITGTYEGRYGKFPLTGTLKAKVLEFSFTMNAEGTEVPMYFRGEVAADFQSIVKGTAELDGMGEASWTARRAK